MEHYQSKTERIMAAVTFAEEGQWDTARSFLSAPHPVTVSYIERMFAAAAFAEVGMSDEAIRITDKDYNFFKVGQRKKNFFKICGLADVRCSYMTSSSAEYVVNVQA